MLCNNITKLCDHKLLLSTNPNNNPKIAFIKWTWHHRKSSVRQPSNTEHEALPSLV